MKKYNKKTLYESIMASVAKEVKNALNEDWTFEYSTNPSDYVKPGKNLTYIPKKDLIDALNDMKDNTQDKVQKAILQAAGEVLYAVYSKLQENN